MYQELRHARPQGTMHWEFTSDYGIAKVTRAGDGGAKVVPTARQIPLCTWIKVAVQR